MEVHGRQPQDVNDPRERLKKHQERLSEANRERAEAFLENLQHRGARRATPRTGQAGELGSSTPVERNESETPVLTHARHASDRPGDRVELSAAAEALTPEVDPERAARVSDLRRAHEEGRLLHPARLERAAEGILRG